MSSLRQTFSSVSRLFSRSTLGDAGAKRRVLSAPLQRVAEMLGEEPRAIHCRRVPVAGPPQAADDERADALADSDRNGEHRRHTGPARMLPLSERLHRQVFESGYGDQLEVEEPACKPLPARRVGLGAHLLESGPLA